MKTVCLIGGDGIGPEVIEAAARVVDATGAPLQWVPARAGMAAKRSDGFYLPDATRQAVRESDAVLFGAITSPLAAEDPNYRSVILEIRRELDAFANVRPSEDWGQPCVASGIHLTIVRENSEGMYNAPETTDKDGVTTHRRITRRASERVIRFALDWAASHSSSRITCVHKANVLRQSDGLFRTVFQAEAARYPALRAEESLVDSCAHDLVRDFRRFDVLVTLNLYGDILSDLAAGLAGGLGFAPSGNFGPRQALFEPVHGSAPPLAGKDVANPSGAILSAAMMLDYLGEHVRADRIRAAVRSAIRKGATRDAGGKLGTKAFTELVVAEIS